jgi:hypothetical protein
MKEHEPSGARPSRYWVEELASLEYLFDASPLVVERLRHHSYLVTGLRAYDYRSGKDPKPLANKLAALVKKGGRDLLVPEPPLLGGFGFAIDGELYNVDTLKYFEALIAMNTVGLLAPFRARSERRVVWEIGPGWGGFAYQFKKLFPNVTYVLVDLPELFLFSATYLQTAFPDARFVSCADGSLSPDEWLAADFVFVPNWALDALDPPRLDLTVNMVSFQEMTATQVNDYARKAYRLGSPYVYSLNRERSLYNEEIDSVTSILGRYYWTRTVPVLPVGYTKMLGSRRPTAQPQPPALLDYRHVVATRRLVI